MELIEYIWEWESLIITISGDFAWNIGSDKGLNNIVYPKDMHDKQAVEHKGHKHVW